MADAEPALAWLMLVSAVETAADRWDQSKPQAAERLRESRPDLAEAIEALCPQLLPVVAEKIADTLGATRKFLNFARTFMPPPPERRPDKGFQIDWEAEHLRRGLRTIYSYRSKALHTGVPFPAPMCEPPMSLNRDFPAPSEKPPGLASSMRGGVWRHKDLPMSLHIFEYITRSILKAWWSSSKNATRKLDPGLCCEK